MRRLQHLNQLINFNIQNLSQTNSCIEIHPFLVKKDSSLCVI